MKTKTQKTTRHVRRRTFNAGSEKRTRKVTIRCTERVSNELASMQGLMYAFGRRERLADLWEGYLMPVLRLYVKPYAAKAKADRNLTISPSAEGGSTK